MSTKYQKFGLRADRNLTDLNNPAAALTNLLDDISVSGVGFTPDDLLIIDGLRNTAISPSDFIELDGQVVTYTRLSDNAILPVNPLITLQDFIRNFQTIFGSPPFIGGGDGFLAVFVPSERVNPNPPQNITGESIDTVVTGRDDIQLSGTTNLFSTYAPDPTIPQNFGHPFINRDIIGPQFYWDRGVFNFEGKLHPSFSDPYGLIQWTGYMASDFSFLFETTGFFIVEEDTLDDGNWIKKCNIYDQTRDFSGPSISVVSDDGSVTVLQYTSDDVLATATNDIITLSSDGFFAEYTVTGVDYTTATVTVEGSLTVPLSGAATVRHYFEVGVQEVRTGVIFITRPLPGSRTKIRLTHWYPRPEDIGEDPLKQFRSKVLIEDQGNDDRFPFTDVYSVPAAAQTFSEYSYKNFEDVRARPINQDMQRAFEVDGVLLMDYEIPQTFADVYYGNLQATHRGYGRLECITALNNEVTEGDWMIVYDPVNGGSNGDPRVFQVEDRFVDSVTGLDVVYAKTDDTSVNPESFIADGVVNISFFKNLGLVGVFNLNGTNLQLTTMINGSNPTQSVSGAVNATYTTLRPDMLLVGLDKSSGGNQFGPVKIDTTFYNSSTNVTITTSNPLGTTGVPSDANLVGLVYSNAGLKDLSAVSLCAGVFGKETTATALEGATRVHLSDIDGITAGQYIQFGNSIPASNNTTIAAPVNEIQTFNSLSGVSGSIITTTVSHNYANNDVVLYTTGGDPVGGLLTGAYYFVVNRTTNTLQLAETEGGAPITLTPAATGSTETLESNYVNIPAIPSNSGANAIGANATIVFIDTTVQGSTAPAGVSKEFCVIPLNTAPPFEGTNAGLRTTESNPNLRVGSPSVVCKLAFGDLEINDPTNSTVTTLVGTPPDADFYVPIEYNGQIYKLLID